MNKKLCISNIAWAAAHDEAMYAFLLEQGYEGLEIAPTRLFPERPYEHIAEAKEFAARLYERFGLRVASMQSIWYGVTQSVFGTDADRRFLVDYTKRAVDFAAAMGCGNLVFGCPKHRVLPSPEALPVADAFFREIAAYAALAGVVIALEPNPEFYGTNFINTTAQAFEYCRRLSAPGLMVNVDLGTSIHCGDSVAFLSENAALIHHVHISEPMLAPIQHRALHGELAALAFDGYFSIEMGNKDDLALVQDTVRYVKEALHGND